MEIKEKIAFLTEYFNEKALEYFDVLDCPENLKESMKYSFFSGGKRIRPILLFLSGELFEIDKERLFNYALSLEMVHTYSLIHDDLPSMDNDDFRRGKPSSHKKFGEAFAILTGDSLLNLSFQVLFEEGNSSQNANDAKLFFSKKTGIFGMIKGQIFDIYGAKDSGEKGIYEIIDNKTSALIQCAVLIPSILSGKKYFDELEIFSLKLGEIFQITDDLFDFLSNFEKIGKTVNKDKEKNTFVNLLGIDKTKELNEKLYFECKNTLKNIPNSSDLCQITDLIYNRTK